ncbi:Protein kinase domain protein [anaerobic digester metagenome]
MRIVSEMNTVPIWRYILFIVILLFCIPIIGITHGSLSGISIQGGEYVTDTIPENLSTGHCGQFMIEFRNTGMTAWEYDVEKFGVEYFSDNSLITIEPLINLLPKGSRVHNGQSYQFPFSMNTHNPGEVTLSFALVRLLPSGKTVPVSGMVNIPVKIIPQNPNLMSETGVIQVSGGVLHLPVKLDNIYVGMTPLTLSDIHAGFHKVEIEGREGVMEKEIEVLPNSLNPVLYDPEDSFFYIETKNSLLLDDTNPFLTAILSNFFIVLGFVITLTVVGICAVVVITGKMKRVKFTVSQILPFSIHSHPGRDFSVEVSRKTDKDEVRFDPIPGIFTQGREKKFQIKITNLGKKDITVENHRISPGEIKLLYREIKDDSPGDNVTGMDISYIGSDGKKKTQFINLYYRILPKKPDLSWVFERFFIRDGRVIAVIKIKNKTLEALKIDSVDILPGKEGKIFIGMDEPDIDSISTFKNLHIIDGEGGSLSLPTKIPYNRGIFLFFSKQFSDSQEWFHQQMKKGINDPNLQKYAEIVEKKIMELKIANNLADQRGDNENKKGMPPSPPDHHHITNTNILYDIQQEFPEDLISLYQPSGIISEDRLGMIYRAVRVSDNEEVAVRILKPGKVNHSTIELQIQAWRSLKHLNILQIKYWERDPQYYLEFDLPSGVLQSRKRIYSLADVKVPIPPRASLKIIRGLAEGIDYLHHQGVRHYLLEPSVVLLDKGLNPKISGFDAAALVQSYIPEDCWIIAPEQCNSAKYGNPGKKTDIYQVGAICYYLITGQIPSIDNYSDVLPSHINPDLNVFDNLIRKTLSPYKNGRYGEVNEMIQEIDNLIDAFSPKIKQNSRR